MFLLRTSDTDMGTKCSKMLNFGKTPLETQISTIKKVKVMNDDSGLEPLSEVSNQMNEISEVTVRAITTVESVAVETSNDTRYFKAISVVGLSPTKPTCNSQTLSQGESPYFKNRGAVTPSRSETQDQCTEESCMSEQDIFSDLRMKVKNGDRNSAYDNLQTDQEMDVDTKVEIKEEPSFPFDEEVLVYNNPDNFSGTMKTPSKTVVNLTPNKCQKETESKQESSTQLSISSFFTAFGSKFTNLKKGKQLTL